MSNTPPSQEQSQSNGESNATQALAAAAAMKFASQSAVVRICGTSPSECGYCRGARAARPEEASTSSKAYSLLGDFMTPKTYEGLLYRGWRRSGSYLYKPDNWTSCCPALTIRLPVNKFEPTKSQRKVVKKMEQILQPVKTAEFHQPPTKKRKKNKRPCVSAAEQLVEQGGVLDQVQRWTRPIAQSLAESQASSNIQIDISKLNFTMPFKIKPHEGKSPKKEPPDHKSDRVITICTTICAAVSGQSKGVIDRDNMSRELVNQLKSYCGHPQTLRSPSASQYTWILTDVYRHAKSGQVFCDIQLPEHLVANMNEMKDANMAESDSKNKLQRWLEQHGPEMTPFTKTGLPNSPPFSFTVETLPAHESALDPEVHKLYFLYQHKVHQDPDPYTCDLFQKRSPSNSMNPTAGPDEGPYEDDEWSTPATSDAPRIDKRADSVSSIADKNPPGWTDTAKRMLQKEYPNVSDGRLKQITKTFGSFFQFLVESPFPAPKNGENSRCIIRAIPPISSSTPDGCPSISSFPCGTYHQQYRVAGMLVAVGVVDILPQGLSSVYLFYHPQFARDLVPLGKYAILQEIEFARSIHVPYYYLGYYIESCTKMKYKAEYRPSELLCPTTYKWVDAARAQKILLAHSPVHHCCRLYYDDNIDDLDLKLTSPIKNGGMDRSTNMEDVFNQNCDNTIMDVEHITEKRISRSDENHRTAAAAPQNNNGMGDRGSSTSSAIQTDAKPDMPPSILKKPSPVLPNPHVEQVKMDVGVGLPVTLPMLHERGRETVRPLLEDFVKEAGADLSKICLVKFI